MMDDLLIHTSSVRVDVLEPNKLPGFTIPCVCFSRNQFISYFGEYVYLFSKSVLEEDFFVEQCYSKGVQACHYVDMEGMPSEYRFKSEDLGYEYRVYHSVDVRRYGLGVITNFNHLRGVLEKKLGDVVIKELIDFSR